MHAIWSGSISFGLVNIPIQLYSGSKEHELDLTMLHKKDHSPIRYAKICRAEEKEIPYQDIVKGYEVEKGKYVVLSDKDFAKAETASSHVISIVEFINADEIDVRYFQKPYYLEPQKSAEKSYALLREALAHSKKVALAIFSIRNRERIGIISTVDDALVLITLRYATEVVQAKQLELPAAKMVKKSELDMALALIKQLTKKFNINQFKDKHNEELEKAIKIKTSGKTVSAKSSTPKPSKAKDLMTALKASLANNKSKSKPKKKIATHKIRKAA